MSRELLETICCKDGSARHLEYHQQRINRSLKRSGSSREYDLASRLLPPDKGLYRCRIIYDDTTFTLSYLPYRQRVIQTLQLVQADHLEYALKYADRTELDTLFAQKEAADDILIVKNGLITDTSIANIAFFDGRQWVTPKCPLLKGTTRERLLDEKKIIEGEITQDDLGNYTAFALMNAMIGFNEIKNGIIAPLKGENNVI